MRLGGIAILLAMAAPLPARADVASPLYVVRHESWSADDEAAWRDFVGRIGASDCATLDACLKSDANPFRGTDRPEHVFQSDCAELPYVLRFYFAWKRSLPFAFESGVEARGATRDIRYSRGGNRVTARLDVASGTTSGYAIIDRIRATVSSASYRIHPDAEQPQEPDFYSPALRPAAIVPGTVVYDPAGHVGIVYKVDAKGRVRFFDAHTDFSLTETAYDLRFAREAPAVGAGFKNWRPIRLVGATRRSDGALVGGRVVAAANKDIADFSTEQFYGNGARPRDGDWKSGTFTLNGEQLDYYDYVRARMAGDRLVFEPVVELAEMVRSNCTDLRYRADAVERALAAGIQNRPEPKRLPDNIYGTQGDWETYSTPSRDARLKTAFKATRDNVQRFVEMAARGDPHLAYTGDNLAGDLLKTYDRETSYCRIAYTGGDGRRAALSYEDARQRLFAMSFDPYHCVERRWGSDEACADDPDKRSWYDAERNLRNQIERTYEARMDFTLDALKAQPAVAAPDTDVRAYLAAHTPDSAP